MKKLMLALIATAFFAAPAMAEEKMEAIHHNSKGAETIIWRHTATGCYYVSAGTYRGAGITQMLDANGKPYCPKQEED